MSDDKKEIVCWSIGGGIVVILFVLIILRDISPPPSISCDSPSELKSHTVFLFDFSDPITDDVAELIKNSIKEHQNSIENEGKLTLLRLTRNLYESEASICKPPNPSDKIRNKNWSCSESLTGIDSPRQDMADKFCEFSANMDKIIQKIEEGALKKSIPSSPLIESVSKISREADFTAEKSRTIVLFSDLLQNTDKYSFYPGRGPSPVASEVVKNNNIDLSNVKVAVQYIQRQESANDIQRQQNARKFWEEFFKHSMATLKITPM